GLAAVGAVRRPLFRRGDGLPGRARLGAGLRRRHPASADPMRNAPHLGGDRPGLPPFDLEADRRESLRELGDVSTGVDEALPVPALLEVDLPDREVFRRRKVRLAFLPSGDALGILAESPTASLLRHVEKAPATPHFL